jgi:hypothetical protein
VRIRGGQIVRVGALAPGIALDSVVGLCADANITLDEKLPKLIGALGESIARVEYGRAGEKAGVDIYLEPGEPAAQRTAPVLTEAN